jgi:hypothetical protein
VRRRAGTRIALRAAEPSHRRGVSMFGLGIVGTILLIIIILWLLGVIG